MHQIDCVAYIRKVASKLRHGRFIGIYLQVKGPDTCVRITDIRTYPNEVILEYQPSFNKFDRMNFVIRSHRMYVDKPIMRMFGKSILQVGYIDYIRAAGE